MLNRFALFLLVASSIAGVPALAAKPKARAVAAEPAASPTPAPAGPTASDWRSPDPQNLLVIDTNKGRIIVEMYPQIAPAHVARIRTLAQRKFYDGLTFFRVIDGFMDQTGDPKNTGTGGSDLPDLKAEFTFRRGPDVPFVPAQQAEGGEVGFIGSVPIATQSDDLMTLTADGRVNAWGLFCPGTAGMARSGDPDSGNSQFYLMRDAYTSLNHKYTVWGRVLVGLEVVRSVKTGEPVEAPQDQMLTMRLASDLPEKDRPKVVVLDTRSAWFKGFLDREKASKGADFSVCDVAIPAKVNQP